jgi:hypothetical protein
MSELPFAIVIYLKRNGSSDRERPEVFCAPSSWIVTNSLAYWPPYNDLKACTDAARNKEPPVYGWPVWDVEIKKRISKYENYEIYEIILS